MTWSICRGSTPVRCINSTVTLRASSKRSSCANSDPARTNGVRNPATTAARLALLLMSLEIYRTFGRTLQRRATLRNTLATRAAAAALPRTLVPTLYGAAARELAPGHHPRRLPERGPAAVPQQGGPRAEPDRPP